MQSQRAPAPQAPAPQAPAPQAPVRYNGGATAGGAAAVGAAGAGAALASQRSQQRNAYQQQGSMYNPNSQEAQRPVSYYDLQQQRVLAEQKAQRLGVPQQSSLANHESPVLDPAHGMSDAAYGAAVGAAARSFARNDEQHSSRDVRKQPSHEMYNNSSYSHQDSSSSYESKDMQSESSMGGLGAMGAYHTAKDQYANKDYAHSVDSDSTYGNKDDDWSSEYRSGFNRVESNESFDVDKSYRNDRGASTDSFDVDKNYQGNQHSSKRVLGTPESPDFSRKSNASEVSHSSVEF